MSARIGGIVLAAGASRRAGGCKALARLGEQTFVGRAVRTLREGGCDDVLVVVGPPHGDAIAAAVPATSIVRNGAPERGMLSSLRLAVESARAAGWDAAVVSLVDHPRVRADTVARLVDAWRSSGADLVAPRFDGRGGHPYVLARSAFDAVLTAPDTATARTVHDGLRNVIGLDVDDPAILEDLDLPDDVADRGP